MAKQRFVVHTINGERQASAWMDDPEGVAAAAEFFSEHGLSKTERLSLEPEGGLEIGSVIYYNTNHVVAVEIQTKED